MPFLGGARLPNAYDIAVCDISVRVAFTNKAVLSPGRGIGIVPSRFALDRALDMLAHRLGKEPADVRRLNLIAACLTRQPPASIMTAATIKRPGTD